MFILENNFMVMNIVRYQRSKYGVAIDADDKFSEDQSGKVKLKELYPLLFFFLFFSSLTNGVEGKGRKSGKKKRNYASYYLCSTFPHALWPQRYTYLKSQPHNPNIFGVPYHASLDSSICAKCMCIFQPARSRQ